MAPSFPPSISYDLPGWRLWWTHLALDGDGLPEQAFK